MPNHDQPGIPGLVWFVRARVISRVVRNWVNNSTVELYSKLAVRTVGGTMLCSVRLA